MTPVSELFISFFSLFLYARYSSGTIMIAIIIPGRALYLPELNHTIRKGYKRLELFVLLI